MSINDTSREPVDEPWSEPSGQPLSEVPSQPLTEALGEPEGQTVTVIGFGRRLVAYIIDAVILWAVGLCLGFGVLSLTATGASQDAVSSANLAVQAVQCVSVLIALAYFVIFWATTGQTPGKMALGIKVIETDGSPVTWGKAILRYIGYVISGLVLSLGFIWIAFDSKRQGWHDKIANTYVVHKDTEFSATAPVTIVPSDAGSSVAIVLVLLFFVALIMIPVVVIAVLLLLGPVIGNVFSNIVEGLTTPVPQ